MKELKEIYKFHFHIKDTFQHIYICIDYLLPKFLRWDKCEYNSFLCEKMILMQLTDSFQNLYGGSTNTMMQKLLIPFMF